jgi:hypothetical protein
MLAELLKIRVHLSAPCNKLISILIYCKAHICTVLIFMFGYFYDVVNSFSVWTVANMVSINLMGGNYGENYPAIF